MCLRIPNRKRYSFGRRISHPQHLVGIKERQTGSVDQFPKCIHVETVVQLVNIGVKPDYTVRLEVDVDEFYKTVGEEKRNYLDSEEYKKIKAKNKDK